MTPTDPFEEGEQTQIRPDRHHHDDLEEPGDDFERDGIEKSQWTSELSETNAGEELLFKGTSKSETKSNSERKEEKSSSRTRNSFRTLYDKPLTSLLTDGLSS